MASWLYGSENHQWKGGKVVTASGYVLIRVGRNHPMSDCRGYAYEHRLVVFQKLGRRLKPGEIVHHKNGDKTDNRLENLEIVYGNAEHFLYHRRVGLSRRRPGEANVIIQCECMCGRKLLRYDKTGRPRRFISGHNLYPKKEKSRWQ